MLTALSNNVLGDYPEYVQIHECEQFGCKKELNRGVFWSGIVLAGGGVVMAIIGKARERRSVGFVPMRGGGAVFRTVRF